VNFARFAGTSPLTIRFKILALAFVILIIFGVVVGISTWLQHQFTNQIVAITHYVVPLRTHIADFDVLTDEYELITLRLLRQSGVTQNELENTRARARQGAKRIAEDIKQFDALVDQALEDPSVARQTESIFSELKGATPFITRQLDPFFKRGSRFCKLLLTAVWMMLVPCLSSFVRLRMPLARTRPLCGRSWQYLLVQ
jgi:hypothetical protein